MLLTLKQFLIITLIIGVIFSTGGIAYAIPIFSIGGAVTDDGGNPIADGTEITLTNDTRNLSIAVKVGENTELGKYAGTFITTDEGSSAAEPGDEILITVQDGTGKVLSTRVYQITATDIADAKAIVDLKIVTAVGEPASITLSADSDTLPGDGFSELTITATVKDQQGKPVTNHTVTFTITKGGGKISPTGLERGDGTYTGTYTAAQSLDAVEVTGLTANGKSDSLTLVLTEPTKISSTRSTVIATTPVVADGVTTSTITITLLDANGEPIRGKRVEVAVDGEGNVITQPSSPTNALGKTTATLASTKAELKRITAAVVDEGIDLTDGAAVLFQSGPATNLTVAVSPDTLPADGTSIAALTITVTDPHGNPVIGENVSVGASAGTVASPATDNGNGTYRSRYVSSTAAGIVTLTASTTGGVRGEAQVSLTEVIKDTVAEITLVSVSGSPAKAGGRILITVNAEPNGETRFSIAGIDRAQNVLMAETSTPGTYQGGYTGVDGDNVTDATVTVFFTDAVGNQTTDASQTVTLDTTLPPPPANLKIEGDIITRDNQSALIISGNVTPNAEVRLTLSTLGEPTNQIETIGISDSAGAFRLLFDVSTLKDGPVVVNAVEATDVAGNIGIPATIVTIKETQIGATPDFSLNAPITVRSADTGKSVVYFITVLGTNGFDQEVSLIAAKLPKGVSEEFSQDTVTPTVTNPLQGTQLTLQIGEDAEPGEFQFEVLGTSADGRFKRITLTLTIRKVKFPAFLTLQVEPNSIPFGKSVKFLGSVLATEIGKLPTELPIAITYLTPTGETIERETVTSLKNEYELGFNPKQVGSWQATARWEGDSRFSAAEQTATFEVTKGVAQINWPSLSQAKFGQPVTLEGQLDPPLEDETISLRILPPSSTVATIETVTTLPDGFFEYTFTPDEKETWIVKATWIGNAQYNAVTAEDQSIEVISEQAKAIVLLGGGNEEDNPAWRRFNGVAQRVYKVLLKRTFSDDDIFFLSPGREKTEQIDDVTSMQRLDFAIRNWAAERVNANVPLLLYMISHNTEDQFLLEKQGNREVFLSAEALANMLNALPSEAPVTIVIEACHSENFILATDQEGNPLLPRVGRTVIASARSGAQAQLSPNLSSFSKFFFDRIDANDTVAEAFSETEQLLKRIPRHRSQSPKLDTNGNGIANERADFRGEAYIPEDIESLANEPQIVGVEVSPAALFAGETSAQIIATVIGPSGIPSEVSATITPPDYDSSPTFTDWNTYDVPTIEFIRENEDRYVAEYDQFTIPGDYTIVIFAENSDGPALPVEITVTVSSDEKSQAPWDVNDDGTVNIFDLVLVGGNFGKSGVGDVNGDGTINIFDLVLVGSHFGEVISAAPASFVGVRSDDFSRFSDERLKSLLQALAELEALPNPSRGAIIARDLLRGWLTDARQIVTETKLLPNYPNPFNPETWIPYQLAESADVTIAIYDARGRLIRTLHLGQRAAGFYTDSAKAAYWDGRNAFREEVASGIYFYQLTAESGKRFPSYTATRRMAVVK